MIIIIYLMTFDTVLVTFTLVCESELYRGLIEFIVFGPVLESLCVSGWDAAWCRSPLCRPRPWLSDPRHSPSALPAASLPTNNI